jgi:hypothetical protein
MRPLLRIVVSRIGFCQIVRWLTFSARACPQSKWPAAAKRLGKPARARWRSRPPALNQTKLRPEPDNGSWLASRALAQHAHRGPDFDHHQVRGRAILC